MTKLIVCLFLISGVNGHIPSSRQAKYITLMTKKVAILQSNYIPWKGYFDMIAAVDEFILYDDRQYTRRDWRNRNQIKTPQGVQWLTIPVKTKGKYDQEIRETQIQETDWAMQHWRMLTQNYRRAPFFKELAYVFEPLYKASYLNLSALNRSFIEAICQYLKITTLLTFSWEYQAASNKAERLMELCLQAGATEYISGPLAKNYIEEAAFADKNIKLTWFDYEGYPPYPQLWGEFTHGVSILDLLFNCGKEASRYMRYVKP